MKKINVLLLVLILALGILGCTSQSEPSSSSTSQKPETTELTIAAAASLTDALNTVISNYASVAPNVKITTNYASSGALQTQTENGAPVDIFFSAANKQMDALNDGGLIMSDSIVKLLKNEVVLIIPSDSTLTLSSFEEAAGDSVTKIAIGDPASVPVGQYAQEAYTTLNLWDKVSSKAVFGSSVKQVLSWVVSGDVECGIVYKTDAAIESGVKIIASAPENSHKTVEYPVGVVKASTHQEAALAFIEYLKSDEAAVVFEEFGFVSN